MVCVPVEIIFFVVSQVETEVVLLEAVPLVLLKEALVKILLPALAQSLMAYAPAVMIINAVLEEGHLATLVAIVPHVLQKVVLVKILLPALAQSLMVYAPAVMIINAVYPIVVTIQITVIQQQIL